MITYQDTLKELTRKLCQYEIQLYTARYEQGGWLSENKMNKYFQSTPEKMAFSRLMYLARSVNQLYSPSDIAETLHISRTAAHNILNETVQEGWVEQCCSEGNRKFYRASDVLTQCMEETASWTHDAWSSMGLSDADWLLSVIKSREKV